MSWLLVSGLLLFLFSPAAAAVWEVPGTVATIGGAVAGAAPGDTVLIACGTYFEHDITLSTEITILGATGDPDCVVIDAGSAGRVFFSDDPAGEAYIEGVTMTGGSALGAGALDGWGGGMLFIGAPPTLVGCRIIGNTASAGGGLALGGHGLPTLTDCVVSGNTAIYGGGLLGQVVAASLSGCTFADNAADSSGGGIYGSLIDFTLDGCTFHGNASTLEGGALYGNLESVYTLTGTILSFSVSGEAAWCDETSFATATCCDVYGNAGGDWVEALAGQGGASNNFSADPIFCDAVSGDFTLRSDSPCLPGQHPAGAACGLVGAHGQGCDVVGIAEDRPPAFGPRLRLWPNPFRSTLYLSYELPAPTGARVGIFDVNGRRVRSLDLGAGTISWDGRDDAGRDVAAGSYYIRFDSPVNAESHRVLLLR